MNSNEDLAIKQAIRFLRNTGAVQAAIAKGRAERLAERPQVVDQLAGVRNEISRTEDVMRRYQLAFEAGDMAAQDCGDRLQ